MCESKAAVVCGVEYIIIIVLSIVSVLMLRLVDSDVCM